MNYINNQTDLCCCGFGESEKIEIQEGYAMIDCESGEPVTLAVGHGFIPGHQYRCEKRWELRKSYHIIKSFDSKESAEKAYNDMIQQLSEANKVVEI